MKINIKNIPEKIGIYILKDKNNNPIYIGKTINLRERIKHYIKSEDLKIKEMLKSIKSVEFLTFDSEAEALLKESELIKKFDPIFNHLLKDDTQYFYVGFTKKKFPKVLITHQFTKYNAEFIGPFTEGSALKKILKIIRKDIPFCTCLREHKKSCLNSILGLCYGWCCKIGEIGDEKIYNRNIEEVKKLLKGDLKKIKKELLKKMEKLLKKDETQEAIEIHKQILSINKIISHKNLIKDITKEEENLNRIKILKELQNLLNLKKLPYSIEAYDISHFSGDYMVGVRTLFKEAEYDKNGLRKFRIKTLLKPNDPAMIYEVLCRRLKHKEWSISDLIIIDGGKTQFNFALKAIEENNLRNYIKIISISKPNWLIYYERNKNPINLENLPYNLKNFIKLIVRLTHDAAIRYHRRLREKIKNVKIN